MRPGLRRATTGTSAEMTVAIFGYPPVVWLSTMSTDRLTRPWNLDGSCHGTVGNDVVAFDVREHRTLEAIAHPIRLRYTVYSDARKVFTASA